MAIIKTAYYGEEGGWIESVRVLWKNEGDVNIRYTVDALEEGSVVKTGDGGRYEDVLNFIHNYPDDTEKTMRILTKTEIGVTSLYNYSNFLIDTNAKLKHFTLVNTPNLSGVLNLYYNQNISKFTILNDITTVFGLVMHSSSIGRPYDEPDFLVSDDDFYQAGYNPLLDAYSQDFSLYDPIPGFVWISGMNTYGLRGYQDGIALYGLQIFERIIPSAQLKRYFAFSHQFGQSGYPYGHTRIELYQNGIRIHSNYYAADNPSYEGYDLGGNVGNSAFIFEINDLTTDMTIRIHSQEFQSVRGNEYGRVEYKFSDTPFVERPLDLSKIKGGLTSLQLVRTAWIKHIIFPDTDEPINNPSITGQHYWWRGDPNRLERIDFTCPVKGQLELAYRSRTLEHINFYKDSLEEVTGIQVYNASKIKHLDFSRIKNFTGTALIYGINVPFHVEADYQLETFIFPQGSGGFYFVNNDKVISLDMVADLYFAKYQITIVGNALLESISFNPTSEEVRILRVNQNKLSGVFDASMFSYLHGELRVDSNVGITGINFSVLTLGKFTYINFALCDFDTITDLSNIQNEISGQILFNQNARLEEIIWSPFMDGLTTGITVYWGYACNLTGVHDVSMFRFVNANFRLQQNYNLTGLLFADNGSVFSSYFYLHQCGIVGHLDLSMVEIYGEISIHRNPITSVAFKPTSGRVNNFHCYVTDIAGVLDLTMFTGGFNNYLFFYQNPYLTRVDFHNAYVDGLITQCYFNDCPLLEGIDLSNHKFHPTTLTYIRVSNCPNATYLILNTNDVGTLFEVNINNSQITEIEWWPGAWDRNSDTNISKIYVNGTYFDTASFNKFLYDLNKASTISRTRYFYPSETFPILDSTSGGYDGSKAALELAEKGWRLVNNFIGTAIANPIAFTPGVSKKLNSSIVNSTWVDCGINKAWLNFSDFHIEVKVSNLDGTIFGQGIVGQSLYGPSLYRWGLLISETNGTLVFNYGNTSIGAPIPASSGVIEVIMNKGGVYLIFNRQVLATGQPISTACSTAYRMLVGAYNNVNGGVDLSAPQLYSNVTIHHVAIRTNGVINVLDLEEGIGDTVTWSGGDIARIKTTQDINYINGVMWEDDDSMLTDYDTSVFITKSIPIQIDYDATLLITK